MQNWFVLRISNYNFSGVTAFDEACQMFGYNFSFFLPAHIKSIYPFAFKKQDLHNTAKPHFANATRGRQYLTCASEAR